ncbi:uncharacterized protein LOC126673424 isoform X4 [Mercurialis annua]|uniref:uncharacterized protein LOC126673424 isoform X4 n=1 Tax=Mercurialis annua TaxID=3986 RepID=UPI00215F1408|nr:uncharacterized protein LOC126673424 isoform X4 [Mercurialis annua]
MASLCALLLCECMTFILIQHYRPELRLAVSYATLRSGKDDCYLKQKRNLVQARNLQFYQLRIDCPSFVFGAATCRTFANACRLEDFSHNGMHKTIRTSQEVYIHPSCAIQK